MSYTRNGITVVCKSNPEVTYARYYSDTEGNLMERYNMTVKKFADHFLPSNAKIKVVKSSETIFDGTLDELYYYGANALDLVVAMVGAEENKVCLSCRNC